MFYNFHLYIDSEINYSLKDVILVLDNFQIQVVSEFQLMISIDDFKIYVEFNNEQYVLEEAVEMAEIFDKPILANCSSRFEIYSDEDFDNKYIEDQLDLLKAIAPLSLYILDNEIGALLQKEDLNAENSSDSRSFYLQQLKVDPENTVALEGLAQFHVQQNDFEKALEYLEKLLELEPDHLVSNKLMANFFLNNGKPLEALKYAQNSFEHGDVYASGFNLAKIFLSQSKLEEAIDFYAIVLRSAENASIFWTDFDNGFTDISKFNFSLQAYENLKNDIIERRENLPALQLNEISNLWSKGKLNIESPMNEEKIWRLEALELPEIYMNWLSILNCSYDTTKITVAKNQSSIYLKNYDELLSAAYEDNFVALFANGYVIFAETSNKTILAFDTKDNSIYEVNLERYFEAMNLGQFDSEGNEIKTILKNTFTDQRFDSFEDLLNAELVNLNMANQKNLLDL